LENTGDEAIRAINTHKEPVPLDGTSYSTLTIRNCTFININGSAIKIESDGDVLTPDGYVLIENCTFYQCQRRVIWERDHENTIMRNLLIVDSKIGNDTFSGTGSLITFQRMGSFVANVDTFAISGAKASGDTVVLDYGTFVPEAGTWSGAELAGFVDEASVYALDPGFADAANGNFTMSENSPLLSLGHDGGAIGDRRWTPDGQLTAIDEVEQVPTDYVLSQNYPNPFNPSTKIEFTIPASGIFSLKIYNILGQEVANLINQEIAAGHHVVNFDASRLSSGVYIYSLQGNNTVLSKKMLLLK
ncbi:MAG: DUF5123 domain-containing protein, partial [Bacteroidetes bacterium]|nr:DUF5123 domain-containing protein [Bacteroidota bacterium]